MDTEEKLLSVLNKVANDPTRMFTRNVPHPTIGFVQHIQSVVEGLTVELHGWYIEAENLFTASDGWIIK